MRQDYRHDGVEEFYYVIGGKGRFQLGDESEVIQKGDAVPIFYNEVHGIENTGSSDLEVMVVGVSRAKWALDAVDVK